MHRRFVLVATLAAVFASASLAQTPVPSSHGAPLPYQDATLPTGQRVNDLVGRMTLEEKAAQMVNTAPAIPRLGVPAYDYWSEGLHGVARSGYATLFPQAIGMAATFDKPLLLKEGEVVGTEARAKYNDAVRQNIHSIYYGLTIWSPNINIFRDPRWGRGQETLGEDPYLTATLGSAFVKGIQGDDPKYYRAIATPKHFAVHSGPESERHRFNVDASPHDLWDTYLPAFRATIVDAKAASTMCAYNRVDGAPACASPLLLKDTLRRDWKFSGFVTSDCWAIDDFFSKDGHHFSKSAEQAAAEAVRLGTDTNCGETYLVLPKAVRKGLITEAEVDTSLRRLFMARFQLGLFDDPAAMPYAKVGMNEVLSPAHKALALQAARESIVLLKNDHAALPLKPGLKTIAVIGPNAASLLAIEGNYNAIPRDPVMPVDGIAAAMKGTRVLYAQGAPYAEGIALPIPRTQLRTGPGRAGTEGLHAEYFDNNHFAGRPVLTRVDRQIDFDWTAAKPAPAVRANSFSVRWTGTLQAPAPGDYPITTLVGNCYPCHDVEHVRVTIDGKERINTTLDALSKENRPPTTSTPTVHFADLSAHPITIEYTHRSPLFGAGLSLMWTPPVAPLREAAVAVAQKADAVVAFVGLNANLEGEEMPIHVPGFSGGDRTDIALPAAQQQMLEAVKATGKPLIVVLLNGSALAVNWADQHADAILEAWYPGQAGAQALAETLSGRNNPSGRLPVTFYRAVDDLPAFTDYSMRNRTYRYYKGKPLFPFGFGLSYTNFTYSNPKLSTEHLQAGDTLHVEADVLNRGPRAGDEVAEIYLTPPQDDVAPVHVLAGFERVHLLPGKSAHVSFDLDPRTLSLVNAEGVRAVRPGTYHVDVGGAQPAESGGSAVTFTIEGTQEIPH